MIEALRQIDIVRKYDSYRGIVHYHCKKGHFQRVILPMTKRIRQQRGEIELYLSGYKIQKDQQPVNPAKLIEVPTLEQANVYCTYWGRLYFFKLPKGMVLTPSVDPLYGNG